MQTQSIIYYLQQIYTIFIPIMSDNIKTQGHSLMQWSYNSDPYMTLTPVVVTYISTSITSVVSPK